jgi:hypothetical protein
MKKRRKGEKKNNSSHKVLIRKKTLRLLRKKNFKWTGFSNYKAQKLCAGFEAQW